ncbi:hypothetical protein KP509_15G072100 [Ceratopteris richardii]|uniref:Uncharacterized protein n=1 Tax=Ceratopteris richardii TaxID=49495 RepID=A0A8T2T8G1_CERRI|nr:hypothetical protein KP509_15G072100 [Ceratopteris richardii]
MASGERRSGTFRRGMTVLGKIPTSNVPKPINLPSQRSESRELESNVQNQLRGICGWDATAGVTFTSNHWRGGSTIIPPPKSSGAQVSGIGSSSPSSAASDGGGKIQENLILGSKAQAFGQTWVTGLSRLSISPMQAESTSSLVSLTQHSADSRHGYVKGIHNSEDVYSSSVSKGMSESKSSELPAHVMPCTGALFQEVYPLFLGKLHDEDVIVQGMANKASVYEGFQSSLSCTGTIPGNFEYLKTNPNSTESYDALDERGKSPSQVRYMNLLSTTSDPDSVPRSNAPAMTEFSPSSDEILLKEKGRHLDLWPDLQKYKDGQYDKVHREEDQFFSESDANSDTISTGKNERNHSMLMNRRHYQLEEAGLFSKEETNFLAMAPDETFTLLKRAPQSVENSKNAMNNSAQNDNLFSQDTEHKSLSMKKDVDQGDESGNITLHVKASKMTDTSLEVTKPVTNEVKISTEKIVNIKSASRYVEPLEKDQSVLFTSSASDGSMTNTKSKNNLKHNDTTKAAIESIKQAQKLTVQGHAEAIETINGVDDQMPARKTINKEAYRESQRLKKNQKNEKAWRPKSSFSGSKVVRKEQNIWKGKHNSGLLDKCDTERFDGSNVSSWPQNQGAKSSLTSDIRSKAESPFLLIESNNRQDEKMEYLNNWPEECENESSTLGDTRSSRLCHDPIIANQSCTMESINHGKAKGFPLSKTKDRLFCHKAEETPPPKLPAVERGATEKTTTYEVLPSSDLEITTKYEVLPSSDLEIKINCNVKIGEQQNFQASKSYDYEGQRARLKEIASQRAKQRRKEEEIRERERKAKARAKLEELERRASANARSDSMHDASKNRVNSSRYHSEVYFPMEASVQNSESSSACHILDNDEIKEELFLSQKLTNNKDILHLSNRRMVRNSKQDESGMIRNTIQDKTIAHMDSLTGQKGLSSSKGADFFSFSSKKYGLQGDVTDELEMQQRSNEIIYNNTGQTALVSQNQRMNILDGGVKYRGPKLWHAVSQLGMVEGESRAECKESFSESHADGLKEQELIMSDAQPNALCISQNNDFFNSDSNAELTHQSTGNNEPIQASSLQCSFDNLAGKMEYSGHAKVLSEEVDRFHV